MRFVGYGLAHRIFIMEEQRDTITTCSIFYITTQTRNSSEFKDAGLLGTACGLAGMCSHRSRGSSSLCC